MGFHRKFERLQALRPDIAVIPECANLDALEAKAPSFAPRTKSWIGENPNKGLGIFTFEPYRAQIVEHVRVDIPYFAPLRVEGPISFNVLAVWACHAKQNSRVAGLGPLPRAIKAYRGFMEDAPAVFIGDFNDNVLWDRPKRANNHGANVEQLEKIGLRSAYHAVRGIGQGREPESTIYWRDRKRNGPRYHIDYAFVPEQWIRSISSVTVGTFEDWVETGDSDHVPLIIDIELPVT